MNQSNQTPRPEFVSLYTTDQPIREGELGDVAGRIDWAVPAPPDQPAEDAAGERMPGALPRGVVVYNTDVGLEPTEAFHDFTRERLGRLVAAVQRYVARFDPDFYASGLLDFGEMLFPQWARMPAVHRDRLRGGWASVWKPAGLGGAWFNGGQPLGTAEHDYDAFAALVMRRLLEAANDACPVRGGWSYPTTLPARLDRSGADGEVDAGTIAYPIDGVGLGCERNTALAGGIFRAAGRVVVQLYFTAMADFSGRPIWDVWGDGLIPAADLYQWARDNLVEALRIGRLAGLPVDVMTHPMFQRADKPFDGTMVRAVELRTLLAAVKAAPFYAARQPWAVSGGGPAPRIRAVELWGSIGTINRVGMPIDQQLARVTEWARGVLWPTVAAAWPGK